MATKVTKRDNFNAIIEVLKAQGCDNLVAVMEHEIELLNKKHGGVSKADKERKEANVVLCDKIATLIVNKPMTATDIAKAVSTDEVEYTNQKISAMLRQIGDKVTKEVIKGKTYFSITE